MSNLQKPGENPDRPGEYLETGPRGGAVPRPRKVTIELGDDRLPPTQEKIVNGSVLDRCVLEVKRQRQNWKSVRWL